MLLLPVVGAAVVADFVFAIAIDAAIVALVRFN